MHIVDSSICKNRAARWQCALLATATPLFYRLFQRWIAFRETKAAEEVTNKCSKPMFHQQQTVVTLHELERSLVTPIVGFRINIGSFGDANVRHNSVVEVKELNSKCVPSL